MKPKWKAASCWGSNPELLALSHQGISTELPQLDKYPLTYSWNVVWTNQITPMQGTQGTSTLLLGNNERVVENNERIVKNKIRSHDHHCVLIWLHNHSLLTLEQERVNTEVRPKHYSLRISTLSARLLFLKRSGVSSLWNVCWRRADSKCPVYNTSLSG